tara:strand:- start:41 stop:658 length:618 start_codon:yes stop_codon:yes gene_type:complete
MAIRTAVNRALTAITALPTAAALVDGNLTLLTTATASSSATLSFTSSINSTYNSYLFKFINIHPATDQKKFMFQGTTDGSNFNTTMTTTWFQAYHDEADSDTTLSYIAGEDQAQGTAFQSLCEDLGNDADQNYCGELQIFSPSSTVFVKHFMAKGNETYHSNFSNNAYVAGYFNTTSAITGLQFKMESGNIDAGVIKMYGVGPKQ